jgi:transcriptional regulator with XRE-family HTH domain
MANTQTPSDVVAARVRELRTSRGMKVADLAARCAELGAEQLTVQALYKLEGQRESATRRPRPVSVDELLALAAALDVAPVHLLVPPYPSPQWGGTGKQATNLARSPDDPNTPNDEMPYQVTSGREVPCWRARQFIRGIRPLPGMDAWRFFGEVPPHERPDEEGLAGLVQANELYQGGA